MGADFLLAHLVIDQRRTPDFAAGRAAIERVASADVNSPDEFCDDCDLGTEDRLDSIREALRSALAELEWALEHSREVDWIEVRGARVFITGGLSYGDPPTRLFESVFRLRAVEGVLDAVGFENAR